MCRSPSHLNLRSTLALAALAALASLAVAGCGGEQAARARDPDASVGGAGGGGGKGGSGGSTVGGGGAGSGGSAGSVTGSGGDGTGGSAGAGVGGGGTSGTGGGVSGNTGMGGTGGSGGAGGRPTGPGINGSSCTDGGQCMSSWCVDGVCCINSCAGTCMRCDGTPKGNCTPVADMADPDDECKMDDPSTCGNTGNCNGAGACRKYGSGTICDSVASCSGGMIVKTKVCNGIGGPNSCVANGTESCNGYLCSGSPATCGTSCADDSSCAPGAFCAAGTCVATPNIAGNGDLEYGTTAGWSAASGTSTIAVTMAAGNVNSGQYAISDSARMAYYQGPGYLLPTGLGALKISAFVIQRDPNWETLTGALTVAVRCKDTTASPYFINFAQGAMARNVWAMLSGTIDLAASTSSSDCGPANGGLVRSVLLYLNQTEQGCTTGTCPDLFMDDLVVNVTDGHNLVGNPNFEAGFADGWGVSSGSAVQAVVTTFAHGGTHSLRQYTRQTPATGPRFVLPTGYARYDVSLWVMQNGTVAHDLILQSTYTCLGGSAQTPPPTKTLAQVVPGMWTQLIGTVTLPPANAPPGCKMTTAAVYVMQDGTACGTGAGQVECPDLYVDDALITLH